MRNDVVIASEAKQSSSRRAVLDCFVAALHRGFAITGDKQQWHTDGRDADPRRFYFTIPQGPRIAQPPTPRTPLISVGIECDPEAWSIFSGRILSAATGSVRSRSITDALNQTDVNAAHEKLLGDLAPTANDLSEFTFGFAKAIFQKYINPHELVMTVVAKIGDAPDIADARLPHYVETPGLRNS